MKKAHQDLLKNIDQLFNCLNNNRDIKLLSDQREKLNILIRFINEGEKVEEKTRAIKPIWYISIEDPLNVGYYINEIVFLLRHNYNEIKLSNAEKAKPKNLITLIKERVMTDEEEQRALNKLQEKALDTINRKNEEYKKTPEHIEKERKKINKELFELKKELGSINKRIAVLNSKLFK